MNRFLSVALALILTSAAQAEEIPLDTIYAMNMPGTVDVQTLDPTVDFPKLSRQEANKATPTRRILSALRHRPKEGEQAGPAFIVEGVGAEALKNTEEVITKRRRDPPRYFPPDKELSLVFYAFMSGRYVQIESVENEEKQIIVKYRLVSHDTANATTHFALVPIGKLAEGTKYIKIEQLPPTDKSGEATGPADARRFVCESSAFHIRP